MQWSKTHALLAALLVLPLSLLSQDSSTTSDQTIKVDVNVVNVLCTVRDNKGKLISTLDKPDFELREDGKEQKILYFSRETKVPLTLGLLIDSSPSQGRLIEDERDAASQFFGQVMGKQDDAFLISFDVNVDLLQDVTSSVSLLRDALNTVRVNGGGAGPTPGPVPTMQTGGTHLFDAVYLGSHDVLQNEVGRKALILITDGQDQGSQLKREDAIEAAQKANAIIYGILFADRGFYGFGGFGYSGESTLKTMAEETGGRMFDARNNKELTDAFEQISNELRTQYSLGYSPTNTTRDGKYRKLEVAVSQHGMKVQARKGYYAPKGQ